METKDVLLTLRTKRGLSQEELAERIFVTRQAVSRWENGETVPNVETLKLLSKLFDVSINTLLGSPQSLVCQCCGMPLEDAVTSKEVDGEFNEEYCKWCYADGKFVYDNLEELTDYLVGHMSSEAWPPEAARSFFEAELPRLRHWKRYAEVGGDEKYDAFRRELIREFNALQIEGMPEVRELSALVGSFVNLEYPLPSGERVRLLDDGATYLGYQLEGAPNGRCFGLIANTEFLLVSTYGEGGADPELLVYKKR